MDLENEEAMNLQKPPIGKYMDFFAGKTKILTMVQMSMPMTLPTLQGWYSPQMVWTLR